MDFAPTETQQDVSRLAARVLRSARPAADQSVPLNETYDRALWMEFAHAGLLALVLPAWLDGDGLGVADAAAQHTETGRRGAAVPALATLMTGVLPVTHWGERDLQQRVLAGVATGDTVLTAALREPPDPMPALPATVLADGAVSGVKVGVPYCAEANWVLVPARAADGGTAVAVIDPAAAGVSMVRTPSYGGEPEYTLRLSSVPAAGVLTGQAVPSLYEFALAGACCLADGAVAAALELTTAHIRARRQFGRALAEFQAVAQQIADVYIVARTLHLAALSACWRLAEGRSPGRDHDVAAYWLAGYAPAALRTCHHLHGGTGMDVTYPLPRLSALIRDLVRFVGGTACRLDRLADRIQA